ncbi:hypothetical protein B0I35DRAFT_480376 [Stachybotrys elegans]|uniref:Uncharacterized protein n=1 Tax=Stachybotrys elegans TaxID=80388 RepID=A0A8K0SPT2_9HYPO|nr:hypothetical protein B0I35DRAFT_480376 [Stachybotrys elegans]
MWRENGSSVLGDLGDMWRQAMPFSRRFRDSTGRKPALRYHITPAVVFFIYMIILIVPWVLLCILAERPFSASSYYDQRGTMTRQDIQAIDAVVRFANGMRAMSALLSIPITSTIMAYAAVRYSQRRKADQVLSTRQLFFLADRGWMDLSIMWPGRVGMKLSGMVLLGAGLVFFGIFSHTLQSILITFEPINAMSCLSVPAGDSSCGGTPQIVAEDAEPWAMARVSQNYMTQEVASRLMSINLNDSQPYLWPETTDLSEEETPITEDGQIPSRLNFFQRDADQERAHVRGTYFASSVREGTTTGVLRENAMRMNSSATCEIISRSSFPSTCDGDRPLEWSLERDNMQVRLCVPGSRDEHPWTTSRDRQDVEEEMFLDFQYIEQVEAVFGSDNFTIHCTTSSARGYFELGNIMNSGAYGPLIDTWPDAATAENDFNDFLVDDSRLSSSDEMQNDGPLGSANRGVDPYATGWIATPGPLMTTTLSLFGNTSFLRFFDGDTTSMSPSEAFYALCTHGNIPYGQIHSRSSNGDPHALCNGAVPALDAAGPENEASIDSFIDVVLASWFNHFKTVTESENLLNIGMFVSNEVLMTQAVTAVEEGFGARPIYYSEGTPVLKPSLTPVVVIAISVLIGLQGILLGIMAFYGCSGPTWTPTLDAMAMARIGQAMADTDLPPIGPVERRHRMRLKDIDAVIGVDESIGRNRHDPSLSRWASGHSDLFNDGSRSDSTGKPVPEAFQLIPGAKGMQMHIHMQLQPLLLYLEPLQLQLRMRPQSEDFLQEDLRRGGRLRHVRLAATRRGT